MKNAMELSGSRLVRTNWPSQARVHACVNELVFSLLFFFYSFVTELPSRAPLYPDDYSTPTESSQSRPAPVTQSAAKVPRKDRDGWMCLAIVPSKDSRPKGGGPTTDNEKRIIKEWDALDSNQYKQCGGRSKTDTSCLVRRNCKSDGCPVQMKYVRGNRTLCRCQYGERNDTLPIIVKPSTSGGTRARRSTTATTSRSRDQPAMANRREANHRSNMPTTRPRNAVTGRGVNALSALSRRRDGRDENRGSRSGPSAFSRPQAAAPRPAARLSESSHSSQLGGSRTTHGQALAGATEAVTRDAFAREALRGLPKLNVNTLWLVLFVRTSSDMASLLMKLIFKMKTWRLFWKTMPMALKFTTTTMVSIVFREECISFRERYKELLTPFMR